MGTIVENFKVLGVSWLIAGGVKYYGGGTKNGLEGCGSKKSSRPNKKAFKRGCRCAGDDSGEIRIASLSVERPLAIFFDFGLFVGFAHDFEGGEEAGDFFAQVAAFWSGEAVGVEAQAAVEIEGAIEVQFAGNLAVEAVAPVEQRFVGQTAEPSFVQFFLEREKFGVEAGPISVS